MLDGCATLLREVRPGREPQAAKCGEKVPERSGEIGTRPCETRVRAGLIRGKKSHAPATGTAAGEVIPKGQKTIGETPGADGPEVWRKDSRTRGTLKVDQLS